MTLPSPDILFHDLHQRLETLAPMAFFASVAASRRLERLDPKLLGFAALRLLYENMLAGSPTEFTDIVALVESLANDPREPDVDPVAPRWSGSNGLAKSAEQPDPEKAREWAHILFFELLQNGGKPWEFRWRDPLDGKEIAIPVRLIAVERDFTVGGPAKFRLTTQGLGFLFQTREYRMEAMVSIEQLFLRQQLEKGNFAGALQRLGSLSVLIQQLERDMRDISDRAAMNALQIPFEQYAELHRRIYDHFDQEHREFQEQRRQTIERRAIIEKPGVTLNQKDEETLGWLRKIEQRLDKLIGEHGRLFLQKQKLQESYRSSLENQFARGFRSRLLPETELLDVLLRGGHPIHALTGCVRSFLPSSLGKRFNPWRCFTEWAVRGTDGSTTEEGLEDNTLIPENAEAIELKRLRRQRCTAFLQHVLDALRHSSPLALSTIIGTLPETVRTELTGSFEFIQILIMLHQADTIDLAHLCREPGRILSDAEELSLEGILLDILRDQPDPPDRMDLTVTATSSILRLDNGTEVTDFRFILNTLPDSHLEAVARGSDHD
ncbi:MAG TPA: hypothetical protein PLP29_10445 [Candidatus Ozemobacteraceae bacterium]|nr:hypothetical protein [Candidatus Ozemobacteraceae bacterium]